MCIDEILHKYLHSDNGMDWHISVQQQWRG